MCAQLTGSVSTVDYIDYRWSTFLSVGPIFGVYLFYGAKECREREEM